MQNHPRRARSASRERMGRNPASPTMYKGHRFSEVPSECMLGSSTVRHTMIMIASGGPLRNTPELSSEGHATAPISLSHNSMTATGVWSAEQSPWVHSRRPCMKSSLIVSFPHLLLCFSAPLDTMPNFETCLYSYVFQLLMIHNRMSKLFGTQPLSDPTRSLVCSPSCASTPTRT